MQNVTKVETEHGQTNSFEAWGLDAVITVSELNQSSHVSLSFSVWVQGHGEWANMTLNALCRRQHESQAFSWTERTDCVASSWNARWSLFGVVLAGIILLDCLRSGRTTAEGKAPSLDFCGPVIFLLFFVQIIKRNPMHSEFFNPAFSIGCCCYKSAVLPVTPWK